MAIYSFSAGVFSRSQGHHATAAAAYRAGELIHDETIGQRFDYSRKRGVLHSEIIAPEGTPAWMWNRSALWNAVEAQEKRSDSQLAREIMVALPHELDESDRLDLVREFIREELVARGMVADFSIHEPGRGGDDRNHHCHILLTMRAVDGDGFAVKKAREWNSPELLENWRGAWARHVNDALERAGFDESHFIDHRSLETQGVDRVPGEHLGKKATARERKGEGSARGDRQREIEEANRDLDGLVDELAELDRQIAAAEERRLDGRHGDAGEGPGDAERRDDAEPRPAEPATVRSRLEAFAAPFIEHIRGHWQAWRGTSHEDAPSTADDRLKNYGDAFRQSAPDSAEVPMQDGLTWWDRVVLVYNKARDTIVEYLYDDHDRPNGPDLDR